MRRSLHKSSPPPWAQTLLAWACSHANVPLPTLTWNLNPQKSPGFAGRAYKTNRIMVVEGPDFDHNAATLLHEVAHYVTHTRSQSINHSLIFYLVFWDLIFASSLPLEKIVLAEVAYKPTAWPALLATGYSPSPLLVEMALQAAAGRILRNAEKTVDKLSRALHASPTPSDTSPPYLAYQKALQRWWRLDRAFTLAYPSPSTA